MNNDISAEGLTCAGKAGMMAVAAAVGSPEEAIWTPGDTPAHHQQPALFTGGALVCLWTHTAGTAGGAGQTLVHGQVRPETGQRRSETPGTGQTPVQSPVRPETGRDDLQHTRTGRYPSRVRYVLKQAETIRNIREQAGTRPPHGTS